MGADGKIKIISKPEGPVPSGDSWSTQQNDAVRESDSNSTQLDHVVKSENGGDSNSRQQNDAVRESDAGSFTSRQQGDAVLKKDAEASTSTQNNDKVGQTEEESARNADQGKEKPKTEEDIWVASIQKKLQDYTTSEAAKTETIFIPRVPKGPRVFGQAVEKAYEPSVISIGPYHRGMPHLKNMQKLKWQRLEGIDERHLKNLFKELKKEEKRARSYYPESEQQLESGDFLEMLLLDGFFIVDYLCRASSHESKTKIWIDDHIRNDLLLLENQLPFFVVECVYLLVTPTTDDKERVGIAVKFFQNISPKAMGLFKPEEENFKHLLHLYHEYLSFDEPVAGTERIPSQVRTIPSASFLEEAGIKFKMRKKIDKVINVRFKNGVMMMTPLVIDAFTISQFLNLIEFERAHPDMEPRITGFLQFMDYIINTSEDVALLRKNGILEHAFGSDEEVARIINRLTSGTFHQLPLELKKVYVEADMYCKAKWNRWRATLLRDYFGSPWATIATVAAILLLSFSFIQTFFSAASYLRPSSAS